VPKTHKNEKENILHPVGENFLVQCVGYRGLAHRNSAGEWKSILGNKTLPKKISFLLPGPLVLPVADPLPDEPGKN